MRDEEFEARVQRCRETVRDTLRELRREDRQLIIIVILLSVFAGSISYVVAKILSHIFGSA